MIIFVLDDLSIVGITKLVSTVNADDDPSTFHSLLIPAPSRAAVQRGVRVFINQTVHFTENNKSNGKTMIIYI